MTPNHRSRLALALIALLCAAAAPASAADNLLVNGGFDDYTNVGNLENPASNYTPVSWLFDPAQTSASVRVELDDLQGLMTAAQSGTYFAKPRGDSSSYLYQTVSTDIGQQYTLSFYAARANANNSNLALDIDVFSGVPAGPGAGSGDLLDASLADADIVGAWTLFTYDFVATATQSTLRFLDPGTTAVDPGIDTVTIVASGSAAPTPAALPAGLAALAMVAMRRGRR